MTVPIVALEEASFAYPNQSGQALCQVEFALGPGDKIGVIGDNGSGKTSLLLALVGLRPLAAGRLIHGGREVRKPGQYHALRRDVGLVFQNCDDQLFSPTVIEDVAFGPLNVGLSLDKALAIARETLDVLHIGHLEGCLTHTLSGGQKRIVSLATALAMKPKALLLDEPTNDLDRKTRAMVQEFLLHSDLALVLVSHDHSLVRAVTTSVVCMEGGRVLSSQPTMAAL
ncbi:energy-coupling factor ABC transporter ATP-binding protein [Pseudodesulfovibrio alkaliphilus]|uniref:energy-coupling factor ABC transporter ATP-binding protein n=1 Tax=Pseudodesulfovibrio alkaliphilus TaxID=2661613 RepID=UPI0018C89F13|nr:ABC transporter ATP-binding protein [Pseudodesulfovibrio alkaliphilus]